MSPARSDESTDDQTTPRPLSLASSSSNTLTSSHNPAGDHSSLHTSSYQSSRAQSSLSLFSRGKKRPAPLPPDARKAATLGGYTSRVSLIFLLIYFKNNINYNINKYKQME